MSHRTEEFRFDDDEEEEPTPEREEGRAATAPGFLTQRLFDDRTVLLFSEIDQKSARDVVAQILAMAAKSDGPIRMILNTPGGSIVHGDSICDIIRFVKAPVKVIGTGAVASMGVPIMLSTEKKNRFSLPNTRFLIHQPLAGYVGRAVELEIHAREIIKVRKRIYDLISRETGQPFERIQKDADRDYWLGAEEAVEYGIVNRIIDSVDDLAT